MKSSDLTKNKGTFERNVIVDLKMSEETTQNDAIIMVVHAFRDVHLLHQLLDRRLPSSSPFHGHLHVQVLYGPSLLTSFQFNKTAFFHPPKIINLSYKILSSIIRRPTANVSANLPLVFPPDRI